MKKITLLSVLLIIFHSTSFTQIATNLGLNAFWNDIDGSPLKLKKGYEIEGSPLLFKDYLNASVIFQNGKKFDGIPTNINLETNKIIVKNVKGEEIEIQTPIYQLVFENTNSNINDSNTMTFVGFNETFTNINSKSTKILEDLTPNAKYHLFKNHLVNYTESQEYGSTIILKKYNITNSLVVINPNKPSELIKLNKSINAIINYFKSLNIDVKKYIEENKLDMKKEGDIMKVFNM